MKGLVTTSSCSDPATISSCFLLLYVPFLANFISHTIRKRWQHACYCFLELCIFKQHISFCSCHSSTIYLMWITQLPITAASFILLPVNSDFSHSLKVVTVLHWWWPWIQAIPRVFQKMRMIVCFLIILNLLTTIL